MANPWTDSNYNAKVNGSSSSGSSNTSSTKTTSSGSLASIASSALEKSTGKSTTQRAQEIASKSSGPAKTTSTTSSGSSLANVALSAIQKTGLGGSSLNNNTKTTEQSKNVTKTEASETKISSITPTAEEENYYLNTYGITKEAYDEGYSDWKNQTDRYTDYAKEWIARSGSKDEKEALAMTEARASEGSYQNWLLGNKSTMENWGTNDDGSTWNAVGNTGVTQKYYDSYKDALQYKSTNQGNINTEGNVITLKDGREVTKVYEEGYGSYYAYSDGTWAPDTAATNAEIRAAANQYSYPTTAATAETTGTTNTGDLPLNARISNTIDNLFNGTIGYLTGIRYNNEYDDAGDYKGVSVTNAMGNEVTTFSNEGVTTKEGSGNYANFIDDTNRVVDTMGETGASQIAEGNYLAGGLNLAGNIAANVALPLDLVNSSLKMAKGEGDQLTAEDAVYAGIDAIGLIPLIGGGLKALLKGGTKTAGAIADTTKAVDAATDAGKAVIKSADDVSDLSKAGKAGSWVDDSKAATSFGDVNKGVRSVDDLADVSKGAKATEVTKAEKTINAINKTATGLTIAGTTGVAAYSMASGLGLFGSGNETTSNILNPETQANDNLNQNNSNQNLGYETRGNGTTADNTNSNQNPDDSGGDNGTVTFDGEYSQTSGSGGGGSMAGESGGAAEDEGIISQIVETAKNNLPVILIAGAVITAIIILAKNSKKKVKA